MSGDLRFHCIRRAQNIGDANLALRISNGQGGLDVSRERLRRYAELAGQGERGFIRE